MTRYAEGTTVSSERSQIQIQQLLKSHGATDVGSAERGSDQAIIIFLFNKRQYRISIQYPALQTFSRSGRTTRTLAQMRSARDQEIRRLWRVLLLVIKAKIEIVESGIISFEEEFMPFILTADGQTLGEWIKPQLERHVPLMLPSPHEEEYNV
jgi:hypothetical protein